MTDGSYLQGIRTSYDTVAESYADLVRPSEPWESSMLTAFAELVLRTDAGEADASAERVLGAALVPDAGQVLGARQVSGRVLDAGCGPGRVTARLHSLGLPAFGVDLSPGMIEIAQRDHPGVEFAVGSMTDLDLKDGELAGVLSWWSIVHLPREILPTAFAEFHRVLTPGGRLLVGFHVGDTHSHKDSGYGGHPMSLDVYRWQPDQLAALAAEAGFTLHAQVVIDPTAAVPGACLFFQKPVAAA
ncbi:class I SAM-dependent methyltransferase [Kribbella sancticallisti]|uniref:Class I SAM-dependent methyltransferase n=1 Tax=Kribbella sancticallisti TaxID=460087 RepID=A0ABN2CYN1_9ACTN